MVIHVLQARYGTISGTADTSADCDHGHTARDRQCSTEAPPPLTELPPDGEVCSLASR